jgi:hypothetical protein
MAAGAVERLLKCVEDPTPALSEKDDAILATLKFRDLLEQSRDILPSHIYEGLSASSFIMTKLTESHKMMTELLFAYIKYERTIHLEDRLHAIYLIRSILRKLREWVDTNADELQNIDLEKLRLLQGIMPEAVKMNAERWRRINTDEILTLCYSVEDTFEKGWEYYKWNIIL